MPYKLIGHIPCGTEACTTAIHSSSECNSVNGNINVDLTPVAKESTLLTESEAIKTAIANIDLSSVESKVEEESQAIQSKIDNIKLPEIDTTELAKQGDDQGATNTAIYNAVKSLPDLSLLYAARAEKNDDGVNTYSIVLPVTAKVTYDNNGVATIQL